MKIIGISPQDTEDFVLSHQLEDPPEDQIKFRLRTLSYRDRLQMVMWQETFDRINRDAFMAMGLSRDQVVKDLKADGIEDPTKEQIVNAMAAKAEALSDEEARSIDDTLKSKAIEVSVDAGFIHATIGAPGKPKGLVGWSDNFEDANGDPIKFDPDTYLEVLPNDVLVAIAMRIYNMNTLSKETAKN